MNIGGKGKRMKIETEDLTQKLSPVEESFLLGNITEKYDRFKKLAI